MPTLFTIHGPIEVPVYQGKAGRTITKDEVEAFWKSNSSHAHQRGCYVFGIRAGKGFTPGYVGKATKSFKQELFANDKLAKYQRFLIDYVKGTPTLFLLVYSVKKGKPNTKHVTDLEKFLIQLGMSANPEILNIKGTQTEEWGVQGMLRAGKGKPSTSAKRFKKMMKFSA